MGRNLEKQTNLKDAKLREVSQALKDKYYMFLHAQS